VEALRADHRLVDTADDDDEDPGEWDLAFELLETPDRDDE
jgi:hypothetical protein